MTASRRLDVATECHHRAVDGRLLEAGRSPLRRRRGMADPNGLTLALAVTCSVSCAG